MSDDGGDEEETERGEELARFTKLGDDSTCVRDDETTATVDIPPSAYAVDQNSPRDWGLRQERNSRQH